MNIEWIETSRRRQTAQACKPELQERLSQAIEAASAALERKQHQDGYWCGELTADTTLESDFIFLQLWLYPPQGRHWNPPSAARIEKACRSILDRQLRDGGWNIYPRGPSEVNATTRAYGALKLAGVDSSHPAMVRAREKVLALGGLQACNSSRKSI